MAYFQEVDSTDRVQLLEQERARNPTTTYSERAREELTWARAKATPRDDQDPEIQMLRALDPRNPTVALSELNAKLKKMGGLETKAALLPNRLFDPEAERYGILDCAIPERPSDCDQGFGYIESYRSALADLKTIAETSLGALGPTAPVGLDDTRFSSRVGYMKDEFTQVLERERMVEERQAQWNSFSDAYLPVKYIVDSGNPTDPDFNALRRTIMER